MIINKNYTLTIGIPVYNEENNIENLLDSLIKQEQNNYKLSEIIIISDGSTDNTVKKIKKVKSKKIRVVIGKERLGKSARVNEILAMFKTDVLCLMDGDISIKNANLFNNIFESTDIMEYKLFSVKSETLHGKNMLQASLSLSVDIKNEIMKNWNNGNNYLSFRGNFLILEGGFAKNLRLNKELINNDAYIYFSAIMYGFKPKYLDNITIYFETPLNLYDHINQSSRYQSSFTELQKYFGIGIKNNYKIPLNVIMAGLIKKGITKPFHLLCYFYIIIISKIEKRKKLSSRWEVATSTKFII